MGIVKDRHIYRFYGVSEDSRIKRNEQLRLKLAGCGILSRDLNFINYPTSYARCGMRDEKNNEVFVAGYGDIFCAQMGHLASRIS